MIIDARMLAKMISEELNDDEKYAGRDDILEGRPGFVSSRLSACRIEGTFDLVSVSRKVLDRVYEYEMKQIGERDANRAAAYSRIIGREIDTKNADFEKDLEENDEK